MRNSSFLAYAAYEQLVFLNKDNCREPSFVYCLQGFCFFSFIKSHVFVVKYYQNEELLFSFIVTKSLSGQRDHMK